MEEGGDREGDEAANAKDSLRDCWRKLVESEERLKFFKRMVGMDLEVQEIEHLGEDIRNKFPVYSTPLWAFLPLLYRRLPL